MIRIDQSTKDLLDSYTSHRSSYNAIIKNLINEVRLKREYGLLLDHLYKCVYDVRRNLFTYKYRE